MLTHDGITTVKVGRKDAEEVGERKEQAQFAFWLSRDRFVELSIGPSNNEYSSRCSSRFLLARFLVVYSIISGPGRGRDDRHLAGRLSLRRRRGARVAGVYRSARQKLHVSQPLAVASKHCSC